MDSDELVVSPEALLDFFDADVHAGQHANAIKLLAGEELGLALLCHYLKSRNDEAELLPQRCNSGRKRGPRLDGWVRHRPNGSSQDLHYQVEVKTWSIHGVGGNKTAVPRTASASVLEEVSKRMWHEHYWDETRELFRPPALGKVLEEMNPIAAGARQLPLACLWDLMHPSGEKQPFFHVPLRDCRCAKELWVFSMSRYLRGLPEGTLVVLYLPKLAARLRYLMALFPGLRHELVSASP